MASKILPPSFPSDWANICGVHSLKGLEEHKTGEKRCAGQSKGCRMMASQVEYNRERKAILAGNERRDWEEITMRERQPLSRLRLGEILTGSWSYSDNNNLNSIASSWIKWFRRVQSCQSPPPPPSDFRDKLDQRMVWNASSAQQFINAPLVVVYPFFTAQSLVANPPTPELTGPAPSVLHFDPPLIHRSYAQLVSKNPRPWLWLRAAYPRRLGSLESGGRPADHYETSMTFHQNTAANDKSTTRITFDWMRSQA
ncbi:hypothetical protein F5887DRAFT_917608 [Amanita rubescens]|nr:hypothetical protein F5887DRAFT_917608 [Amanita rubescens]